MEQIYTIPVNEAFEAGREDASLGCPFCRLREKLCGDEVDRVLGASMMEPDTRQETNAHGFCASHMTQLMAAGKRLPLALILESHLAQLSETMKKPGVLPGAAGADTAKKWAAVAEDCYICSRVNFHFQHMLETAALLWESDTAFHEKCLSQPYFCLPHFAQFLQAAKERMKGKDFGAFYKQIYEKEAAFLEKLGGDVSWFVKKFDYRYADEPWNDAKDAVERAAMFLNGSDGTT